MIIVGIKVDPLIRFFDVLDIIDQSDIIKVKVNIEFSRKGPEHLFSYCSLTLFQQLLF